MEGCKLILDSGERREFASGAVRDVQEGKGRADLLPLDVAADLLDRAEDLEQDNGIHPLLSLSYFMGHTADKEYVYNAIKEFSRRNGWNTYTMLLEVSKHFEEGAKKYGARIFWCADEMYVRSGTPLPPYEFWGEFSQIGAGSSCRDRKLFHAAKGAVTHIFIKPEQTFAAWDKDHTGIAAFLQKRMGMFHKGMA